MAQVIGSVLVPALVLLSAFGHDAAPSALPSTAQPCQPGEEPEVISLDRLWAEAGEREPGYRAAAHAVAAEREARAAAERGWLPTATLEGMGNYGQRLSPGEERVLGVGPRGELRLLGSWAFLDSNRAALAEAAERRTLEARAGERAFDEGFRAELAVLYAEAAAADALWEAAEAHAVALRELAAPVEARVAEGVEIGWEGALLEEAAARADRRRVESAQAREELRGELSFLAGRCVRAGEVALAPEPLPARADVSADPEAERLERMADALDAQARREADRDRWRLQLLGGIGPNHSRAFDEGRIRNEYLVGVGGSWALDLGGVRGRTAAAEHARADAARAEAGSVRHAREREWHRIRVVVHAESERRSELTAERERAERRREVALLRWQEGVGRWTDVMQSEERLLELRTLELELELEIARALAREAEITGQVDRIPARFGQAEGA